MTGAEGDLCFPELGLKLGYKPAGCVVFRGTELEDFIEDWHGSRMLVLCPAAQGREAEGAIKAAAHAEADDDPGQSTNEDENEYDPCVTEEIDVEKPPEGGWTDAHIMAPGLGIPRRRPIP
ncbi:hypothetical protein DL771_008171 [Monosporascus sp. 5C6A]|nr:hypothetical protein DL771_008171 [Monosporascus sp. 5C6A]